MGGRLPEVGGALGRGRVFGKRLSRRRKCRGAVLGGGLEGERGRAWRGGVLGEGLKGERGRAWRGGVLGGG